MELKIVLEQENYKNGIVHLKDQLDKAGIAGVLKFDVDRTGSNNNEMGIGDILNSVTGIIHAAEKPLVELVKCLKAYVDNYRTRIRIPQKGGKDIVLEHGRSMTAEQLKDIVVAILQNNQDAK
jgi:hypothetical protein